MQGNIFIQSETETYTVRGEGGTNPFSVFFKKSFRDEKTSRRKFTGDKWPLKTNDNLPCFLQVKFSLPSISYFDYYIDKHFDTP